MIMKLKLPVDYTTLNKYQIWDVRSEYVRIQGGKCHHCGESLGKKSELKILNRHRSHFPENFFKYPIHLHHDHETGMTIGAVHNMCNAWLWIYEGE